MKVVGFVLLILLSIVLAIILIKQIMGFVSDIKKRKKIKARLKEKDTNKNIDKEE